MVTLPYNYKNVQEWSYQIQSAWSDFSSISPNSFLKTAKPFSQLINHSSCL